jgi:hypothetical protein
MTGVLSSVLGCIGQRVGKSVSPCWRARGHIHLGASSLNCPCRLSEIFHFAHQPKEADKPCKRGLDCARASTPVLSVASKFHPRPRDTVLKPVSPNPWSINFASSCLGASTLRLTPRPYLSGVWRLREKLGSLLSTVSFSFSDSR